MRHKYVSLVVSLVVFVCASAEEPVQFGDPVLKQVVEGDLWVANPTPSDMLALTSLTVRGAGISDLGGLEYAKNLRLLDLRENNIGGVGPLSGLVNLESLNVSMNKISDISPLSGLVQITSLDVHDNPGISDISAVSNMPKLRYLVVRHNSIGGIGALSGLSELSHVDLFENQIRDVSALVGLKCLSWIDLRGNPLEQQACEVDIPQIIRDNPGLDIKYDRCGPRRIQITSTAGGHVVSPGEGEFEYGNGEIIELKAHADPCYVFVGWSGSTTGTLNPMRYLVMGDQQIQANFEYVLYELYVDNDAPRDPKPGDARVGDPLENGSRDHPFDTIQEALLVARKGATVFVDRGVYPENITFPGKEVHLAANDPCNANAGPCVTLEGTGGGPVVRIPWGSAQCRMTGFVITKGSGEATGAIYCTHASPQLANCLIVGNRSSGYRGATLYFYDSKAVLINCTIADNYAGEDGSALVLVDSDITMTDSILWGNKPTEMRQGTSTPLIRYSCVRGWWPDMGNTYSDPLFARRGQWVSRTNPHEILEPSDSRAVWIDGDYHLKSKAGRWEPASGLWVCDDVTSPCIDAGNPDNPIGGEPMPHGGIANMGAYGGTTEASKSF